MPYPNEHSARMKDPEIFDPNSFRSKNLKIGIRIILGKLKGENAMTIQAYRFLVNQFTVEEAKKWLKDNNISDFKFEPAENKAIRMGFMDDNINKILQHYGVTGMKWGTRRARVTSSEHSEARGLRKKKLRELSNDEIRKVATRLSLEKQYKDLNPGNVSRGAKAIDKVIGTIGKIAASATTIIAVAKGIQKAVAVVQKHKNLLPADFEI